jgi:glycerophosphoryl diester phosphodiesterase
VPAAILLGVVTLARQHPFLDHPGPIPMAHRGGATSTSELGFENTQRAFTTAVGLGYRYLETDVHVSRDGVVFAFHDPHLQRVTDASGDIGELDAEQVLLARVGGSETIPTMRELFEAFPEVRFNIDVKADAAVEPTARLLEECGVLDRVCLASFSGARLRRLRRRLGDAVATSTGPAEIAALRTLPLRLAQAALRRSGAVCVQVPPRHGRLTVITHSFVDHCHALGLPVHAWTVDDPDEIHALLDRGVDGVISDRIDILRDVLMARGQWTGSAA